MFKSLQLTSRIARGLLSQKAYGPIVQKKLYGIYEPDYLHKLRPQVPTYPAINIQITGYDFPILESYQSLVHKYCETLDINVEDCWALPPKQEKITRLKPNTAVVEATYELKTYKRVVHLTDVKAHILPLLVRIIEEALPQGVTITVLEHTELQEEERYVPDKELLTLKDQLVDMGGPSTKKK